MKLPKVTTRLFIALVILLCCFPPQVKPAGDDAAADSVDTSDDIVTENPEYVGTTSQVENNESNDDDEELMKAHEEDEEEEKEAKGGSDVLVKKKEKKNKLESKLAVGKALSRTRKKKKRSSSNGLMIFQKHGMKVTLVVALYAFRREIYSVLSKYLLGDKDRIQLRELVNPTAILKMILFINLMGRMLNLADVDDDYEEDENSIPSLALFGGRRSPSMIYKFLRPLSTNQAFVPRAEQHYTFERVNERYRKDGMALQKAMRNSTDTRSSAKEFLLNYEENKKKTSTLSAYNRTVILLDLTRLDSSLSQLPVLRDKVSFLLSEYRSQLNSSSAVNEDNEDLEVVVLLESPGGAAPDYALASQQILRLRNSGIKVTICVDKVAASGGYMMACASSPGQLFAAPFALLGSIGVVGQSINIHKTLEGWGIKPLVFRGGRDKAPVGLIGEVTKQGMEKVQDMVDKTHVAFKRHVVDVRPVLADRIEEIATGDVWLGYDALDRGLVDRLVTSDEYIGELLSNGSRILKLMHVVRPKYPLFGPPTATTSVKSHSPSGMGRNVGISLLSDFRKLVERATGVLVDCLAEDEHGYPLARSIGAYDIHASATTPLTKHR